MENLEKKILVVDDMKSRIRQAVEQFGTKVEGIYTDSSESPKILSNGELIQIYPATTEEDIAEALKIKQYGVILMDGNLGLNIEGEYRDGIVVSEKLREGIYGAINKNTPILNTSSHFENRFADDWVSLDSELGGQEVDLIMNYLR